MRWVEEVGVATERSIAYVGGLAEISAKALRLLILSPLKRSRMLQRAIHEATAAGVGAIPIISLTYRPRLVALMMASFESVPGCNTKLVVLGPTPAPPPRAALAVLSRESLRAE